MSLGLCTSGQELASSLKGDQKGRGNRLTCNRTICRLSMVVLFYQYSCKKSIFLFVSGVWALSGTAMLVCDAVYMCARYARRVQGVIYTLS